MEEKYEDVLLDIHSKGEYPADELSNFACHEFYLSGVKCMSMEGFLQALKFKNPEKQKEICLLTGKQAKLSSKGLPQLRWRITKKLWWNGVCYDRFSDDYQMLLDRAYKALSENKDFMSALEFTGDCILSHSVGEENMKKTVLTVYEFTSRLERLRGTDSINYEYI